MRLTRGLPVLALLMLTGCMSFSRFDDMQAANPAPQKPKGPEFAAMKDDTAYREGDPFRLKVGESTKGVAVAQRQ